MFPLKKVQTACFYFQLVSKHFRQISVVEKEVLTYFIYMAKTYKNRFDKSFGDGVWTKVFISFSVEFRKVFQDGTLSQIPKVTGLYLSFNLQAGICKSTMEQYSLLSI